MQFSRNIHEVIIHTQTFFIPQDGFHLNKVDNTFKVFFRAPVNLDRHSICTQALFQLVDNHEEISTGTVHLVDEDHARHFVLIGLAPYSFGLGLNAGRTTQYNNRTIKYAQRTLNFDREVNVSWGIDNVNTMLGELLVHALPETGSCS